MRQEPWRDADGEPQVKRQRLPTASTGPGTRADDRMTRMQLRELNIGCFGGGTGLPSLLGGLKSNPWLQLNAVVTMFDSGGSSGQLRDQLGVLPPGDVLKCALALARNEGEARRVLLARLPTLEQHDRLAGHTGGNLLLSMMEQYSGEFLAAVDGLRALLGCRGRVWPVSVEPASVCAEYADGTRTRGEVEVDLLQAHGNQVRRLWLEPDVAIHPAVADAIRAFDAVDHRSRQLLHEPDAAAARPRRPRGAARHARAGDPDREPADRRPRDVRLHGGGRGALGVHARSIVRSTS